MSDAAPPPSQLPPEELPRIVVRIPAEDPPWNVWDVLRILVVALITVGLFDMIAMALAAHGIKSREVLEALSHDPRVIIPAQSAAYVVVIAYMVAVVRLVRRPFLPTVKWNFPGLNALGYFALGVALSIAILAAEALLPVPKSLPMDQFFTTTTGAYLMAVFGITFAPLMEELFFRGFLYPLIARKWGVTASIAITALAFALMHEAQLAHAWAPLLLLWVVGVVLTGVRARTKSVAASFCIHVAYNFTLFALMFIRTDAFRHLDKLT
ncbi:MAG: lysostaphin resistance A-like protein [Terriglobales bacterium]